jgi:hypothetical protein
MLTPAEELGLSGISLASRVRKAFYKIPEAQLVELMQRLREESFRRHLIYLRDGELDTVPLFACPMTALPDQLSYIHFVTQTIQNALKRLPELYMQDFAVRELLRISPEEERASANTTRSSAASTRWSISSAPCGRTRCALWSRT